MIAAAAAARRPAGRLRRRLRDVDAPALVVVPTWANTFTLDGDLLRVTGRRRLRESFAIAAGVGIGALLLGIDQTAPRDDGDISTALAIPLLLMGLAVMAATTGPATKRWGRAASLVGTVAWAAMMTTLAMQWGPPWAWMFGVFLTLGTLASLLKHRRQTRATERRLALLDDRVRTDAFITMIDSGTDGALLRVTGHPDSSLTWMVEHPFSATFWPRIGHAVGVWHLPDDPAVALVCAPECPRPESRRWARLRRRPAPTA